MPGGIKLNTGLIKWFYQALVYSLSRWSLFRLSPIREELLNQLESAGGRSLGLVGAIGILSGTVIIDQSVRMVGAAGEVPVKLLSWTLFGEAGALAVGFLVAARVAPTMGADLALMRFRGELKHLAAINIPVADYLVVPRVVSLIFVSALLAVYFMACTLLGGMLIASFLRDFSFLPQLARFFEIVSPLGILIAILKCSLFGGVVALISCYYGLAVERDAKRLSQAGSEALTRSLLALGVLDVGAVLLSAMLE
ncbi:MAG: ABC transporter permease [Gallionella sp.]|nr:ABC transporter permease [Gallionella sp.]